MKRSLRVEFLYWEGCPSHEEALRRLREALRLEGVEARIEVIHVDTEEAARRWAFIGSPTIRIEGKDLQPPPAGTPYRLTCRIYRMEDGHISPLPTVAMIREALRRAIAHSQG